MTTTLPPPTRTPRDRGGRRWPFVAIAVHRAPLVALVVATAAVTAAVAAWRRRPPPVRVVPWPVRDGVLADRIRSELGALEHRLDIPRIHVMVERGVALLHGDVPSEAAANILEDGVRAVAGVRGVASHLHVGLVDGDTRPSSDEGGPSAAAKRLVAAARGAGAGEVTAPLAARRVLMSFAGTLPTATRRRVTSHLPPDVAGWLAPVDAVVSTIATVDELYRDVVGADVTPATRVPWVVAAVLRELAALMPDDVDVVAANLPLELGHLWADALVDSLTK